jgi:hypothetical protein
VGHGAGARAELACPAAGLRWHATFAAAGRSAVILAVHNNDRHAWTLVVLLAVGAIRRRHRVVVVAAVNDGLSYFGRGTRGRLARAQDAGATSRADVITAAVVVDLMLILPSFCRSHSLT